MGSSSPLSAQATALKSLLAGTQEIYARLLAGFEQFLAVDPETEPDLAMARDHQTTQLMREADKSLQALRQTIDPWSQRRNNYPRDLAAMVDQFLDLFEKSLRGLLSQIEHRTGDLMARKKALQTAMEQLGQQRRGIKGYTQKAQHSKFLDKKA